MKLSFSPKLKTKLSTTLKSWFPILQSSTLELEEVLSDFVAFNPLVEIQSNIQVNLSSKTPKSLKLDSKASKSIESFGIYHESIYEVLESQILPPLFPTPLSQKIAFMIIDEINSYGYFEGDIKSIALACNVSENEVEQIRLRFAKINPQGVGAKDDIESMIFQLEDLDIDDALYDLAFLILKDLKNHIQYKNEPLYLDALNLIKRFKTMPAGDYLPSCLQIIPDLFIKNTPFGFEVSINDNYYPDILISKVKNDSPIFKTKLKEARDLIDALSMRKNTIKKIGLMILEYQYDFFCGGNIKPMKLKDIAKDLGHSPSTISRAVSNKYLECNRGLFPLKKFFSTAINEDTSNTSIKDFIFNEIKIENKNDPLSDIELLELIESRFGVKMVRRTITKYRKQLNIPSSNERKKLYQITI